MTVSDVREIAFRYLTRREHSQKELRQKLSRKGISSELILDTIKELVDEGLVSDQRFAEMFARSRISRLYGPLKIRAELMKRGVNSTLIDSTLELHSEQWPELARQWVLKRNRGGLDRNEKARLYRSGTSRGFSHDNMMRAIDWLKESQ
ncbi:MAG: regulatory protein [Lysobacterales bacterium]